MRNDDDMGNDMGTPAASGRREKPWGELKSGAPPTGKRQMGGSEVRISVAACVNVE